MSLRFRVKDRMVPVTILPEERRKLDSGDYDWNEGIRINTTDRADEQASTLVHELLHAIWDANKLPSSMTEEEVCAALEGPLLSLLIDNLHLRPILEAAFHDGEPLPIGDA